jgi:phosphohistidine phosphatase SixA
MASSTTSAGSSSSDKNDAVPKQQEKDTEDPPSSMEGDVRPSISLRMIRHAESRNNQVYRNARYIYRGGTSDFDAQGWETYVDTHRSADPGLSDVGVIQADVLADYLVPHLEHQSSHPVRIITSPMRRTLETIRPTLERLQQQQQTATTRGKPNVHIIVNGFYHESDGCHIKDKPGMYY